MAFFHILICGIDMLPGLVGHTGGVYLPSPGTPFISLYSSVKALL